MRAAFLSGRCDSYSTDIAALAGFRFTEVKRQDGLVLLPDVISKEPTAPVVRKGDDKWFARKWPKPRDVASPIAGL